MVRRSIWVVALLLMALATVAQAQVAPDSASYDAATNVLSVYFSGTVRTDSASVPVGQLVLDDDNGGLNANYTLPGGVVMNTQATGTVVQVKCYFGAVIDENSYTDPVTAENLTYKIWGNDISALKAIESTLGHTQLSLIIPEGAFVTPTYEKVSAATVPVRYVDDSNPTTLTSLVYSANENTLTFTFSDTVQFDDIAEDAASSNAQGWPAPGNGVLNVLPPEDRNNNGVLDMEQNIVKTAITLKTSAGSFTPTTSFVTNKADSNVIIMHLPTSEQSTFEDMDLAGGVTVTLPAFAFVDQNYNSVVPVTNAAVTVTADATPMTADSASYDMGTNVFLIDFNQELSTSFASLSKASKMAVELVNGSTVVETYWLNDAAGWYSANSNMTLRLATYPSDAIHVEDMIDSLGTGESMQLKMQTFATYDFEGNGNTAVTLPLTVVDETASNKAPELNTSVPVIYDAETNVLHVVFDLSLDREIDASGFTLTDGTTEVNLAAATAEQSDSRKGVTLTLDGDDASVIENLPDKDALELNVDPYSVLQSRQYNGNRAITGVAVDYTADSNPPLVSTLFYDTQDGAVLVETSNSEFDPETGVDLTKLTLSGVTLAAPDSVTTLTASSALFYLPASVVASLSALPVADILRPTAEIDSGFVMNGDGVYSFSSGGEVTDGAVLSNGVDNVELSLTMGRSYAITSLEAFPTPARTIYAALRAKSDHGYWYVDNAAWGSLVDSTELASAINFFENSTPYDTSMGAREVIMDAYAAGKEDFVPGSVNFIMANVLDEYGEGRNNTNANLWEPGYLDVDNNNIVLDCNPTDYNAAAESASGNGLRQLTSLFAEYVTYQIDPYEDAWIRKGLAYFGEFLIGSRDRNVPDTYTEPTYAGWGATNGVAGANDLTFLSDDLASRDDYEQLYMFMLYLYEKYGSLDIITEIATSPRIGLTGLQDIFDERWAAGDYDSTPWLKEDLKDVFLDFATANLIDMEMTNDPNHGLYYFENIDTRASVAPGTPMKWSTSSPPPYTFNGTNWGFDYYLCAYNPGVGDLLPLLGDTLTLNVGNAGDVKKFRKLNFHVDQFGFGAATEYNSQDIDVSNGYAFAPMSNGADWTFGLAADGGNVPMIILIATQTGDFLVSSKTSPATYARLFVAQNSLYSRKFEAYVISSEKIFSKPGVEAPIVTVKQDTETVQTFDTAEDYMISQNTGTKTFQYFTSYWLNTSGDYEWSLGGQLASGLTVVGGSSIPVTVDMVEPGASKLIALGDDFQMQFSGNAFDQSEAVSVVANEMSMTQAVRGARSSDAMSGQTQISPVYSVRADARDLGDPAVLTIAYDMDKAGEQPVGIYYDYHGEWVYVGGDADRTNGTVTARVGKLGDYQVMAGQLGETPAELALPTEFALKQNYPNPFNPSTTIEMVLPNAGNVRLVIYDVLGREVANLVDGPMRFGSHKVVWNGRNAYGQPLASGVYFVQMQATGFRAVRKMVLVK